MDVFEAIRIRRSIRKFKSKPVEEYKLQRILEAGRLSPSTANTQPWHFIVVTDPSVRDTLILAHKRDPNYASTSHIINAPVLIVACADVDIGWVRKDGEEYWKVDVAIALQSIVLCATEEGLGTCWIAAFDEEATRKALKIPKEIRIVAMIPLGYADETIAASDRKPLSETIHYEHW